MVAQVFHFYAGAVDKFYGETIPVAGGVDMTFREPLGVVGLITPWNFPLNIASWKLGPALACGNTVVLKPAELTPLSSMRLGELALEAGIPEGVVNVVVGKGSVVGQRLIEHPDVAKIGFTGSTEVGQLVMQGARIDDQARHARARRQVGEHRLRRRGSRARGRDRAVRGVRQRGAGLLRALAHPRRAERVRPLRRAARRGDARAEGRRPRGRRDRDGPAHLGAAPRDGRELRRRRAALPRRRAGRQGLLVSRDARRGAARRPDRARGGLRPGRGADPVRRRGRGGADRERLGLRALRLDLDARRRARAARRARGRDRRAVDQLELVGAALDAVRRLQAERLRPRARHARAGGLQRGQERVLLDEA